MKEICEAIESLIGEGCSIMDLHNLQAGDGIDPSLFWWQVKLCLSFQLWSATISEKAGVTLEPAVMSYLYDLNNQVKNRLLIFSNKPFSS